MACVDVLFAGYADDRVAGTVSCVRDGDLVAIVDPGMVPNRSAILKPLTDLGIEPSDVTDVILSHHHPDHTMNIALFEHARVHDTWAIYEGDIWTDRPANGAELSPAVRLMATPGHTAQDITTLVQTDEGVVALTHLWWDESSASDPLAEDLESLFANRERVLETATLIVPGHGAPFTPGAGSRPAGRSRPRGVTSFIE
jgi:glyoxylase-like metal-dependent hydrolase (beta-lactamase superfamily II)